MTQTVSEQWMARCAGAVMHTYGRQPLVITRGEGARLWDAQGREYLDCVAGLAVASLGHAHPAVAAAVCRQAKELVHVSNLYYTTPMIELAEDLTRLSFADRVFFGNSGAEANEGAIKLARRYAAQKFGEGRHTIICASGSFHGRTLATLSATGQKKFWQGFAPLMPGFVFVPFGDLEAAAKAIDRTTCAILVEPIQGEGGVQMPPPGYLAGLRKLCDDQGLLLIFDEVQVGLGRTGRLWCHEHDGVAPDIMTLAKALANGLPIGTLLATAEAAAGFAPGSHASTFGGGPVICAAAREVLRILSAPEFLAQVRAQGEYFLAGLNEVATQHAFVKETRGRGLILALELDKDGLAAVDACREKGLLINCTQGTILRFLPPLIIDRAQIDRALGIISDVLAGY